MTKDNNHVNEGSIVPSAVGAQVYHQPDDGVPPDAPASNGTEAAAPAAAPVDDALARSRAIVAHAKFTRKVDKRDPTCEVIEIRRRALHPIGEPGATVTMTGDEAIMELTGFCVGYLQAMGVLPADEDLEASEPVS